MQDLKLIAINNTQSLMSKARFNSHINMDKTHNAVELMLYVQELNSVILENEQNHLEKERIIRDLHRQEIAKLMDKIIKLQS
tara:strand:+ start:2830 stop:3075 length:246 start_codon:yes stop_codon:yes gene_type:complete